MIIAREKLNILLNNVVIFTSAFKPIVSRKYTAKHLKLKPKIL